MSTKQSITKRIAAMALALCLVASGVPAADAGDRAFISETKAYWSSFGTDESNATVVDCKLPIDFNEAEIIMDGQREKLDVKEPIIVGESLYFLSGKKLYHYDLNGNRLGEVTLYANTGFFSRISYGDGKIFVQLSNRIQCFDAATLESLWLSPTGQQMLCTITYNDGYIYTGYTSGGGGSTSPTDGAYFCLSTADEDPSDPYEVKDFVWISKTGGYYWAGGVVVGNRIYYAGDAGILYAHHLTKDVVYDAFDLGAQVRSNLIYDETTERIIVATKTSPVRLYAVALNGDGTFDRARTLRTAEGEISGVTGGVAAYNGRIYVPSGGMHVAGDFMVLDAATLAPAYGITGLKTQSVPLVCTAYASEENNRKVYVYVIDFTSGVGYIFEDAPGQTAYKEVTRLNTTQMIGGVEHRSTGYNSTSFKADQYGNLYMIGGSNSYFGTYGKPDYERGATANALSVFRNKNAAFTAQDVTNAIGILPDAGALTYADRKAVRAAQTRFDALPAADQAGVANAQKLRQLTARMDELTALLTEAAGNAIQRIPSTVSLADEAAIETADRLYAKLSNDDKLGVPGRERLAAAIDALFALKSSVAGLIGRIDTLPGPDAITPADKALVNELWGLYASLSAADQEAVSNRQRLVDAKDKIKELDDMTLVGDIIAAIGALPAPEAVTLADEEAVNAVYQKYAALHPKAQAAVGNAARLTAAHDQVAGYRAAVDAINALIWERIDPRNITLEDKPILREVAAKYTALRPAEQAYVLYYDDVTDAQEIIASLEAGVIPARVFERIMGDDRDYTASGDRYSITFSGLDVESPVDFNYGMTWGGERQGAIEGLARTPLVFELAETGAFPGAATVTLTTDLPDGDYILYAYDGSARRVQIVTVRDGQAVFSLTQGGTYFLTTALKESGGGGNPAIPNPSTAAAGADALWLLPLAAWAILVLTRKKKPGGATPGAEG